MRREKEIRSFKDAETKDRSIFNTPFSEISDMVSKELGKKVKVVSEFLLNVNYIDDPVHKIQTMYHTDFDTSKYKLHIMSENEYAFGFVYK